MDRAKKLIHCNESSIYRKNFSGQGIRIAVLDTGVVEHPDLKGRIVEFYDCINNRKNWYDDNGHGTHVAGILAGNGIMSNGILAGLAPETDIIAVKVLDKNGEGKVEKILQGLEWIRNNHKKYRIRIVNVSVGAKKEIGIYKEKKLIEAVEQLWNEGLVVVVSAGNQGPKEGSITVPGTSRKVITVGSIESEGKKCNCSGRGPTEACVIKPDILAPGYGIISCSHDYEYSGAYYTVKSGTSMATPMVSGAIAILLSKYPQLTNVEIKLWLRECCDSVNNERQYCGWGKLNVMRILEECF